MGGPRWCCQCGLVSHFCRTIGYKMVLKRHPRTGLLLATINNDWRDTELGIICSVWCGCRSARFCRSRSCFYTLNPLSHTPALQPAYHKASDSCFSYIRSCLVGPQSKHQAPPYCLRTMHTPNMCSFSRWLCVTCT